MGMFDNVFKSLDATLKAIEDGAIEKTLTNAVDALDKNINKGSETLNKIAESPSTVLKQGVAKAEQLSQTSESLRQQAGKVSDIIKRN